MEPPRMAGEQPDGREHLDNDDYRSPHLIVRYSFTGWCMGRYRLLGQTGQTDARKIQRLAQIVSQQECGQASASDDAEADRIRDKILDDFVAFFHDSSRDFTGQLQHIIESGMSALFYSVAYSLPDRYPNPRALLHFNSPDFIEGYLRAYNQFAAANYNLADFTNALIKTMNVYRERIQIGLRDGSIRLDPRYRRHFRQSVLRACDKICDELGEAFWNDLFPPRSDADDVPLPETRVYDLTDESRIYDWDLSEVPQRLVMRHPYAPVLEAHQIAKLKVVLSVLDLFQGMNGDELGATRNQLIALCICYPNHAMDWGLSAHEAMQLECCAQADRTSICMTACQKRDCHHDTEENNDDDDNDGKRADGSSDLGIEQTADELSISQP